MGQQSKVGFCLRMIPFAISFAAVGIATYVQIVAPAKQLPWGSAVAVAVVIALGPGFGIFFEQLHRSDAKCGQKVEAQVIGLHGALCDLDIGFTNLTIGYTVFRHRRTIRSPMHGVQVRIYRLRLTANPKPSVVRWTWRKGLLGECWCERRTVHLDHRKHFAGVNADSRREWRRVARAKRQRLTYAEYKSIRQYHQVIAIPLLHSRTGEYCGCLAIQVPNTALRKEVMRGGEATHVIDRSAAAMADQLK